MSVKKSVSVSSVLLLLLFTTGNLGLGTANGIGNEDFVLSPSQYIQHDSIIIESEEDFIDQGWPGNGTKEDPYLIEGFSINASSYDGCIELSKTRSHVLIRQCRFSANIEYFSVPSIFLLNVTNVIIEECQFDGGYALKLEESDNCQILRSIIQVNYEFDLLGGNGITLYYSNNCTIEQNLITGYEEGISMYHANNTAIISNLIFNNEEQGMYLTHTFYTLVFNNSIYSNERGGISLGSSSNNTIYSNHLGGASRNAWDGYGDSNQWDNGIGEGNFWNDYTGMGVYEIEGTTNSTDRFPTLWPVDLWGLEFQCPRFTDRNSWTVTMASGYTWGYMDSYLISINVTDPAGVDTVHMVRRASLSYEDDEWINYKMTHDPLPDNPDRYTYNVSFQEHGDQLRFHILANDTFGNWNVTGDYYLGNMIFVEITPPIMSNPFVLAGIVVCVLGVIVVYRYRKLKALQ